MGTGRQLSQYVHVGPVCSRSGSTPQKGDPGVLTLFVDNDPDPHKWDPDLQANWIPQENQIFIAKTGRNCFGEKQSCCISEYPYWNGDILWNQDH